MRVLTRSLSKISKECKQGAVEVIEHSRAVRYRLLEISRAAKSKTEAGRGRMRASYQADFSSVTLENTAVSDLSGR
jgi:hypothetical protein